MRLNQFHFSGHMHGATCIDKDHEVIRPCILWNDTRSHQECNDIMNDKSVMDIAGNIAMPGFTRVAPKVLWLKNNEFRKFFELIYIKFLLPKDYLRYFI